MVRSQGVHMLKVNMIMSAWANSVDPRSNLSDLIRINTDFHSSNCF